MPSLTQTAEHRLDLYHTHDATQAAREAMQRHLAWQDAYAVALTTGRYSPEEAAMVADDFVAGRLI